MSHTFWTPVQHGLDLKCYVHTDIGLGDISAHTKFQIVKFSLSPQEFGISRSNLRFSPTHTFHGFLEEVQPARKTTPKSFHCPNCTVGPSHFTTEDWRARRLIEKGSVTVITNQAAMRAWSILFHGLQRRWFGLRRWWNGVPGVGEDLPGQSLNQHVLIVDNVLDARSVTALSMKVLYLVCAL